MTDEEEVEEAEEYEPEKDAQKRIIEKREKPKDEYKGDKEAQKKIGIPADERQNEKK